MKRSLALIALSSIFLAACSDKQAELEQQLKAQQEQIAQLQNQLQDETVYQLAASAVNETLSPEAQEQGKNGQPVTGTDGQQYVYDQSTGSWFLQSLVGAAAGAFIGNALASKFMKAPANSPVAQQVRTQYAQQYKGKMAKAPATLSPRQQAAQQQQNRQQASNNYRPAQSGISNHQQPRRSGFGGRRGRR
ncbi:MAG: hypothetical protein Q4E16_01120 [Neisseria sp.]|nr:hypothetical protein [Neisseria sp.]